MPKLKYGPNPIWLFTAPNNRRRHPRFLCHGEGERQSQAMTLYLASPTEALSQFHLTDLPHKLKVTDPPLSPARLSELHEAWTRLHPRPFVTPPPEHPSLMLDPESGVLRLPFALDRAAGLHPRLVYVTNVLWRTRHKTSLRPSYSTFFEALDPVKDLYR